MYLFIYLIFAGLVMLILVLQGANDQPKIEFQVKEEELREHVDTEMERIHATLAKINTNYAKRNIPK